VSAPPDGVPAMLRAESVSRRFGTVTAVDDVTMHVGPGEVVGLLGANGAGKTTLIRMLLGLLGTSAGVVEVLGGAPDRAHRRRLGYVPQNLGLYRDLTLQENLRFVAGAYGAPVPPLPDELGRYRDALVGSMPLGAQRRAAFVAALAHAPEALLLDEPTSGVGALAAATLWDTVRAQALQGAGVLVTTHNMQEAQQCDRLLLMADGRLVAQGSEADIVGTTTALAVRTDDWSAAFAALEEAGEPVMLDGRAVRVADADPDRLRRVLADSGVAAVVEPVPATIEERMLVLARRGPDSPPSPP
jgi:ABC-type multidrug transport system ATPase subunit